ncbi:MAG: Ig-like domain-containing protein [bacterium]
MKRYIFCLSCLSKIILIDCMALFIALSSYVYAIDVTLAWDKNSERDLAGYRLYYKNDFSDASYDLSSDIDPNSLTDKNYPKHMLSDLENNQDYYFVATAYDVSGYESGYSNEVYLKCISTDEDSPVSIILPEDDQSDDFLFSIVSNPNHGLLSGTPPQLIYAPQSDWHGIDYFTYKTGDEIWSDIKTVMITVYSVNDSPTAYYQEVNTNEEESIEIMLQSSDIDRSPITYEIVTYPAHGTLEGTPPFLTYIPKPDYNGTDILWFKTSDGILSSFISPLIINVKAVNDIPRAEDQSVTTDQDMATTITLTATDADNNALLFSLVSLPAHGTLAGRLPELIYTPETRYTGTDSFQFKALDNVSYSNSATVTITIHPVNRESTIDTVIEYGESEYEKLEKEYDEALKKGCFIVISDQYYVFKCL